MDTREGRESYPIIQSMIPWTEKIYDMSDDEIQNYKNSFKEEYHNSEVKHTREVIDVFYIEYQYYQLRKTYNWVMEQFQLSGDKMAIRREILLQRLRGSTNSAFDPEVIEYFISNMKRATHELMLCKLWVFKIYEHGAKIMYGATYDLDPNIPYMVGLDPANGEGGDNVSITIVNPLNMMIAAEFKHPYISKPNLQRMLIELITEYIPKAVLIVERNSMGTYLIQDLLETEIRDNLYCWDNDHALEEVTTENATDQQLKELASRNRRYGTFVSPKVRSAMFELLYQHVSECKELLCTEYLVNDMCKLVKLPTGKVAADKGEHDDCVMSYLHCLYVYYTGNNIINYGIIKPDHPAWGDITTEKDELNYSNKVAADTLKAITNIDKPIHQSYDDIVISDRIRQESINKEIASKFKFVNDPLYPDIRLNDNDTVDIGSWFFDQMNGTL